METTGGTLESGSKRFMKGFDKKKTLKKRRVPAKKWPSKSAKEMIRKTAKKLAMRIKDGGCAVGEICAGEVTSFDDIPVDSGTKVGVNENVAEREGFCFLTHPFPFEKVILIKFVDAIPFLTPILFSTHEEGSAIIT